MKGIATNDDFRTISFFDLPSFPSPFNFASLPPLPPPPPPVWWSYNGKTIHGYLFQIKFAHCSQGENSTKRERVHSTVDYQPFRNFLGETNSLRAGSKLSAKWRDSIGLIKRCPIRPLFAPKNPDELLLRWRCQSKPSWTEATEPELCLRLTINLALVQRNCRFLAMGRISFSFLIFTHWLSKISCLSSSIES